MEKNKHDVSSRKVSNAQEKATLTPLQLGKYADFTKPVFCPFRNHCINFWIVVRVFRAQLGLICVRQKPSVTVSFGR